VFSDSLKGDGQFYCREHEFNKDPIEAERILIKSHDDVPNLDYSDKAIRRYSEIRFLKRMHESPKRATQFNPAKPGKDWAKRILERQEQGEKLPIIAIDMAKEALKDRV
jgi:hypothetical protein